MKKYLAAGAVAIMVFAFAAMAAQLNVSAETLQVGQTDEGALSCADEAHVYAWLYNDLDGTVDGARVNLVGNDCDGEMLYLSPLDENGNYLGTYRTGTVNLVAGTNNYVVNFTSPVSASNLGGVRIGIDQGSGVSTP